MYDKHLVRNHVQRVRTCETCPSLLRLCLYLSEGKDGNEREETDSKVRTCQTYLALAVRRMHMNETGRKNSQHDRVTSGLVCSCESPSFYMALAQTRADYAVQRDVCCMLADRKAKESSCNRHPSDVVQMHHTPSHDLAYRPCYAPKSCFCMTSSIICMPMYTVNVAVNLLLPPTKQCE